MKNVFQSGILASALLLVFVTTPISSFAKSKEVELAKDFVAQLLELGKLSKKYDKKSKAQAKVIVRKLSQGVDFEGLAAKSLHTTWDKMAKVKRDDFMETLQGMIEEVLFPRAHKISAPLNEIEFSLHSNNSRRVKAMTRFETEKHGEIIEKDLEIDLIYSPSGLIADAWIEGEMVSSNLQRQFDNALKKKSFDQILAQMKKKLKGVRQTDEAPADVKAESQAVKGEVPKTVESEVKKATEPEGSLEKKKSKEKAS